MGGMIDVRAGFAALSRGSGEAIRRSAIQGRTWAFRPYAYGVVQVSKKGRLGALAVARRSFDRLRKTVAGYGDFDSPSFSRDREKEGSWRNG